MDLKSALRGGLLIFECSRFTFLMGVMTALRAGVEVNFPWLVYAVPNALFLLMALFLCLNFNRYREYVPMYISGKILSLSSVIGWFVFSWKTAVFPGTVGIYSIFTTLFLGDLLTIVLAILIARKPKKIVADNVEEGGQQ